MDRVMIFDTTLRDGEQSPGCSMTEEQKYEMAVALERLGVDEIEAGFPVSSPHQFEAAKLIAERVRGPVVAALARAVEKDIDAAAQAIQGARVPRIHTFLATSPIHREYKLKKSKDEVVDLAVKAVKYARNLVPQVEFSPEDGVRTELDFLCRVVEAVIKAGATTINIPDTVGYTNPQEMFDLIKGLRNGVPNIDQAVISVHCHNDLGLGVANTLAAIQAGARQAELTVNGIGERAGNASLEEVVMAMKVRQDLYPFTTGIESTLLYPTSRLLANMIGFHIPRNKAIVGANAFAHESGIHQDGMLKHRSTYEIMQPQMVGREATSIVLGRHSGMHGFKKRLEELGLRLTEDEQKRLYEKFLHLADRKKEVFDDDIYVLVGQDLGLEGETYSLDYFQVLSGNNSIPTATVTLREGEKTVTEAATGDGPIAALFSALEKAIGQKAKLRDYNVVSVTPGTEALGEVTVVLEIQGFEVTGRAGSTDTFEASALAYLNAWNRYQNYPASMRSAHV